MLHFRKILAVLGLDIVAMVAAVAIAVDDPFKLGSPWVIALVLSTTAMVATLSVVCIAIEEPKEYFQLSLVIWLCFASCGALILGFFLGWSSSAANNLVWGAYGTYLLIYAIAVPLIYVCDAEQIEHQAELAIAKD